MSDAGLLARLNILDNNVRAAEKRLADKIDGVEQRIAERIDHHKARISENDMQTLREMFMECAGSIVESERKTADERAREIEKRLDEIDESIQLLMKYERLESRISRLENLTGYPAPREG